MVWLTLLIVIIVAMLSAGYQSGLSGRRSLHIRFVVSFTFGAVLLLIADLDRPMEGHIKTKLAPVIELQRELETATH